jgi:hypothetical protein
MNPGSLLTLRAIRTLVRIMIETLERDRDPARYDDLLQRLLGEIEALRAKENH